MKKPDRVRRFLCQELPLNGRAIEIPKEEAQHAQKVLRLREGDLVEVLDGKGSAVTAVFEPKGKRAFVRSDHSHPTRTEKPHSILPLVLEMAIIKADAMEWVIEKAVELGVEALVPVITDFSVVKVSQKTSEKFIHRWEKIADQSLKQCGRLTRMIVQAPIKFSTLPPCSDIESRFFFDETASPSSRLSPETPQRIRILIGPEGGWSGPERAQLGTGYSLGPLTLRAETAAIAAIALCGDTLRRQG